MPGSVIAVPVQVQPHSAPPHPLLPPLPYAPEALEPAIDASTMTIHHDRHHGAYVANLNGQIKANPALAQLSLDALQGQISKFPAAVRNNGGGHWNHSMFWKLMAPNAGGAPTGAIADAINSAFGDFEKFKMAVNQAGATRFGSGWAWLVHSNGQLVVESTANQDNPMMEGKKPIFGIDVWEHAYYLKYQNRRPDYLAAWWNVINWDAVNARLR